MQSTGIETKLFGPEPEFFVFDSVTIEYLVREEVSTKSIVKSSWSSGLSWNKETLPIAQRLKEAIFLFLRWTHYKI